MENEKAAFFGALRTAFAEPDLCLYLRVGQDAPRNLPKQLVGLTTRPTCVGIEI